MSDARNRSFEKITQDDLARLATWPLQTSQVFFSDISDGGYMPTG